MDRDSTSLKSWIIVMVLLMLFVQSVAAPAAVAHSEESARELRWTVLDKPGATGYTVLSPSDITEMAIGSSVSYVSVDNPPGSLLLRSRNSGYFWEDISSYLTAAGATLPATKLAVAPDQSSIIAAATDGGTELYLSVDSGITWGNVHLGNLGSTEVQSIDISRTYGERNEQRDIVVGTALFGDNDTTGQVQLLHLGSYVPAWHNLQITIDGINIAGDVSAVAFSPNYTTDQTILAIASTGTSGVVAGFQDRTYACMAEVDLSTYTAQWNNRFGYPIEIYDAPNPKSLGDGPGTSSIIGNIAMPSQFSASGASGASRVFYAFYTINPNSAIAPPNDSSNAYKIDDSILTRATAFSGSGTDRYSSIALCGGRLLAGENISSDPLKIPVRISFNPGDASPAFTLTSEPYGTSNVLLGCSGNTIYCGTSGTESGFSISDDNGQTWFQISLIDTTVVLNDVAVATSPQSIFLASNSISDNVQSVWRSAGTPLGGTWGRILAFEAPSDRIIVRVSPDYREDYTVYVCEAGSAPISTNNRLFVSEDRGNNWVEYRAPKGVIDLAPAGEQTVYAAYSEDPALFTDKIGKSTTNGHYWQNGVFSEMEEINMLSAVDTDTLLAGGNHGDVAYTLDGAVTFTHINKMAGTDSPVQVIADGNYADNSIIYAGNGNSIYRRTIDSNGDWEQVRVAVGAEQMSGIMVVEDILYSLWYNRTSSLSGAERSLQPALPLVEIEWDSLQVGAQTSVFDTPPTSLRYTTTETSVILWAIDTANNELMVYFDCLAWNSPQQTLVDEAVIGCDPATGRAQEVNFTWSDICADDRYQVQIAKDSIFSQMVFDSGDILPFLLPSDQTAPGLVYFEGTTSPALAGIASPTLECGHTYYWRVRARAAVTGEIIRSPWSDTRALTIKAGFQVTTPYYGPQLLEPSNGCGCSCNVPVCFSWSPFKETTTYRFELSDNADMRAPLVSTTVTTTAYQYNGQLQCNTAYFWRVMAEEPTPSEWSPVFSLITANEQHRPTSPILSSAPVMKTPLYVWVIIALCVAFIVFASLLILSLMKRNR